MTGSNPPHDDVKILPPDFALLKKIGSADLDKLLSPAVVQQAQDVIDQSSDLLLADGLEDLQKLELVIASPMDASRTIADLSALSFSLKSKAGLAGFSLVATIANSLHARCDLLGASNLMDGNFAILKWHITSIRQLIDLGVKGTGGAVGDSILVELGKLAENTVSTTKIA